MKFKVAKKEGDFKIKSISQKKIIFVHYLYKMKRVLFILLIVAIALSCKKSKHNKLIGRWDLLPQYASDTLNKQVYEFDATDLLIRTTNDTISDTATYKLVQEFNKYYVDIQALDGYNEGHYYIEKINKEILILQCYSPYMRKEFTRAE